ncbi:MAG: hypothetical protein JRI61_12240 [Deltaproteobacteria bacterium]|nr:hypothetical protein [Deltaproteobacteria bacterium]
MNHEEFRRHERHMITDGTLVVLEPDFALIGKIVDISHGGLSFHYKGNKEIMSDSCEVSFVLDDATSNIKYGPFKFSTNIISDAKIEYKNLNNSAAMKCCRMKFQGLSYYQKLWVEDCIRNHTTGPAQSSMD